MTKLKTEKLEQLSADMKDKGFFVKQAYVNRLRILDLKIHHFGEDSDPVRTSINSIVNQTYEEMYDRPDVKNDENSQEDAIVRAKRFEGIYDALTEFSKLTHQQRNAFINRKKPRIKQLELFPKQVFDDMRGRS